jgi:hypothetical protein
MIKKIITQLLYNVKKSHQFIFFLQIKKINKRKEKKLKRKKIKLKIS